MIEQAQIDRAVALLVEAARPVRIVLFGSHARGNNREDQWLRAQVCSYSRATTVSYSP